MSEAPSTPLVSGNIIAASAGTGKTYQLTSRYLALMALGVDPAAIVALTFTKKAAGEFRNRIFKALADGALNHHEKHDDPDRNPLAVRIMETLSGLSLDTREEPWTPKRANNDVALMPATETQTGAADFVQAICSEHNEHPETKVYPESVCKERLGLPANLDTAYFCKLLEKLVKAVNKLTLATIDSFFQQIVSKNTLSLGVGQVLPVTGEEYEQAKRDGLLAMIGPMESAWAAFRKLYRDVTGEKMNNMMEKLGENVQTYLTPYRQHEKESAWTAPQCFGLRDERQFTPDPPLDAVFYEQKAAELTELARRAGLTNRAVQDMAKLCLQLSHHEFKHPANVKKLRNEEGDLTPERAKLKAEVNTLIENAERDLVKQTLRKTEGMFRLMKQYDESYQKSILGTGRFTFDDITRAAEKVLLDDDIPTETAFDYAQRFSHWMLDEFQDTNAEQKKVLDLMLEEVLQPGDSKPFKAEEYEYHASSSSLFVVGDVKQSIYGFRGGTPELLEKMLPNPDGSPKDDLWGQTMVYSQLTKSFRSSPVIMGKDGFINTLFRGLREYAGGKPGMEADAAALKADFTCHESGKPERDGYVRISLLPDGDATATRQAVCDEISRLIEKKWSASPSGTEPGAIDALKGDMSVGILVRKNDEVQEMYHYLHGRFPRLAVEMVSDDFVALSSPLGNVLLDFFLWLTHPSDEYRRAVVQASPLGRAIFSAPDAEKPAPAASFAEQDAYTAACRTAYLRVAEEWKGKLDDKGYSGVVQELLSHLEAPSHARTASEWMQAAQQADAAGQTPEEWVRFIRQLAYRSNPSPKSIQIMTMHKSKGLEFDAVVLPFISDKAVDNTGKMAYLSDATKEHILLSPGSKDNRLGMPTINEAVERWKAARRCEEYNLLYVALSRAKRANYILIPPNAAPCKIKDDGTIKENEGNTTARMILRALHFTTLPKSEETAKKSLYTLPQDADAQQWITTLVKERVEAARERHEKEAAEDVQEACEPQQTRLLSGKKQRRKCSPSGIAEEESENAAENATPNAAETRPGFFNAKAWAGHRATDLGTAVHACFEQVEWLPLKAEQPEAGETDKNARRIFNAAMDKPEIRALFEPQPNLAAFNEQPIDGIVTPVEGGEVWVSGTIDRLVLTYDGPIPKKAPYPKVIAASIIDYKTDGADKADEELRQHYRSQMSAYRKLIAAAYGLTAPSAVTVTLVVCPTKPNAATEPRLVKYTEADWDEK